jgi:hypothetical protein
MKSLLGTIPPEPPYKDPIPVFIERLPDREIVRFTGDLDIDCDGSGGNPHHDPCFQPDTRYHHEGKALNAEKVPYAVVPPIIIQKTRGKVLGSLCLMHNLANGKTVETVVGDSGPTRKLGEASPAAAEALGLSGNPNTGGTERQIILYEIHVGVPAKINGVQYQLQGA